MQGIKHLLISFFCQLACGIALGQNPSQQHYQFPLSRPHLGIPMGNGRFGALVYGHNDTLRIAMNHTGFWHHKNGQKLGKVTYTEIADRLAKGDTTTWDYLKSLGTTGTFQQLPTGSLVLPLPKASKLINATLDYGSGIVSINYSLPNGVSQSIQLVANPDTVALVLVKLPATLATASPNLIPAPKSIGKAWSDRGLHEAKEISWNQGAGLQVLNGEGQAATLNWQKLDSRTIAVYGSIGLESTNLPSAIKGNYTWAGVSKQAQTYWRNYWAQAPLAIVPDAELEAQYTMSIYKAGCLLHTNGKAISLQGPWMEAHKFAPWANDFHWNVNVQMMYQGALAAGKAEAFTPLFEMLKAMLPAMQQQGEQFYGVKGALWLPHATDDQGNFSGKFAAGLLDAGSLGWVAHLFWQHYEYTKDSTYLRSVTYPLLKGYLLAVNAMVQTKDGKPTLPVTVSPEWRGGRKDAWGADASFQWMTAHAAIKALQQASTLLRQEPDLNLATWQKSWPAFTTMLGPKTLEYPEWPDTHIALWRGMDLVESHRHHSHLAAIYPYCTLSMADSLARPAIYGSYRRWVLMGQGNWAGWSFPWAAAIHARLGNGGAAVHTLKQWVSGYTNSSLATLHDANFRGITDKFRYKSTDDHERNEIMQLDASFGYLNAIQEIVAQWQDTTLHIWPAQPIQWTNSLFKNIHLPHGITLDLKVVQGKPAAMKLRSAFPQKVSIKHGLGTEIWQDGLLKQAEPVLTLAFDEGKEIILTVKTEAPKPPFIDWNPKRSDKANKAPYTRR